MLIYLFAVPEESAAPQPPVSAVPQPKPKTKRPPRKRNDTGKGGRSKKKSVEPGLPSNEGIMDSGDHAGVDLLQQLAEKMDDEDESDITDFSDLIKLHEPALHEPALHEPALHEPALHEPALHEPALHKPALLDNKLHEPSLLGNKSGIEQLQTANPAQPQETHISPELSLMIPGKSAELVQGGNHSNMPPSSSIQGLDQLGKRLEPPMSSFGSQENSMSDMMLMTSLQNATGLPDLPPASTTSSPSVSQFSDLSFLCAVAEQQQQEQQVCNIWSGWVGRWVGCTVRREIMVAIIFGGF